MVRRGYKLLYGGRKDLYWCGEWYGYCMLVLVRFSREFFLGRGGGDWCSDSDYTTEGFVLKKLFSDWDNGGGSVLVVNDV